MNFEEAKSFFEKFSLESLESLDLMMPYTDPTMNAAYNSVYKRKFDDEIEEYEGMNEYDNITRALNFNVRELDNLDSFSANEIYYLKQCFKNAESKDNILNKIRKKER